MRFSPGLALDGERRAAPQARFVASTIDRTRASANLARMKNLALSILLLAAACATPQREDVALRAVVEARVAQGFSGAVLLARGDERLLFEGFGAIGGRAIVADDRFWIASTGKQFTSAAILRLADAGLLDIDDTLGRFIPDAPADKAAITLRQLLTHTSGYAQSYVSEGQTGRDDALAAMLAEPLAGLPGERFRYANSNFQLAAAVVEIVSGRDYQSFVRAEFFEPIRMTNTGFGGPETWRLVSPATTPPPERLQHSFWGEQGAFSSADDLYRWTRALWTNRVLGAQSTALLFAPAIPIGEGHAALGWFDGATARGTPFTFTRGNEDFGANSLVYVYPEQDIIIVILTHAGASREDLSWSRLVLRDLEVALGL